MNSCSMRRRATALVHGAIHSGLTDGPRPGAICEERRSRKAR
jgi:hypothetical protein